MCDDVSFLIFLWEDFTERYNKVYELFIALYYIKHLPVETSICQYVNHIITLRYISVHRA